MEFRWLATTVRPARAKAGKSYRNPVTIALEWRKALDTGEYSSPADLAIRKGISRARVTQILNLLRLSPRVIGIVRELGDPLPSRTITERQLRRLINRSVRDQLKEIMIILGLIRTGGKPADGS
jgi:hypothetical protein